VSDLQIIGLSGYARAGKDTVATLLWEVGYRRIAFADILRDAIYAVNPDIKVIVDDETTVYAPLREVIDEIGWEQAKSSAPSIRGLLQRTGTEMGRELFGENFWVDQTFRKLEASGYNKWVISDTRFPNEADAVVNNGGIVWRVERPGFGPTNDHISETGLDNYDSHARLFNAGSLHELREDVFAIEREFFGRVAVNG